MSTILSLVSAVQEINLHQVASILDANPLLVHQRDETGATPLHYATLNGNRPMVQLLLDRGADINSTDSRFGATPTGWAIEYLRENGGYLAIELDDLTYAIQQGDARWVERFLQRFPALRTANNAQGIPFRQLAQYSGDSLVAGLFE